jgi:hypothetical protein
MSTTISLKTSAKGIEASAPIDWCGLLNLDKLLASISLLGTRVETGETQSEKVLIDFFDIYLTHFAFCSIVSICIC